MVSDKTLYLLFLSTGFTVGFGHCFGMCGPIMVSLSLGLKKKGMLVPHILYHGGRIITYSVLGGMMGAVGSFTRVIAPIAGIQKGVMIFSGALIIFMGIAMAGRIPLVRIFKDDYNPGGILSRGFRKLSSVGSTVACFPLGMLLGLLPCGPVYTALVAAARAGMETDSNIEGIVVGTGLMIAFGLGTAPALLLVAKLSNISWIKSRETVYRISSLIMILVGIYFVVKGIRF